VDDALAEEIRVTVIATGFEDRRAVLPAPPAVAAAGAATGGTAGGGRTVDLKSFRGGERQAPWRRPRAEGVRADGGDAFADDLDIPAFLRRQAD
jgi:hypothetical protein